jgi:hypothetical protein
LSADPSVTLACPNAEEAQRGVWIAGADADTLTLIAAVGVSSPPIRLSYLLPLLRWRLVGDGAVLFGWTTHQVDEIWHDEVDRLNAPTIEVSVPSHLAGHLGLYIEGKKTTAVREPLTNGTARIDLANLLGGIHATSPICSLRMCHEGAGRSVEDFALFSIRNVWQADSVECMLAEDEVSVELQVTWLNRGRTDAVAVRVWDNLSPASLIQEVVVENASLLSPGSTGQAVINLAVDELDSSTFWVEVAANDGWSSTPGDRPPDGSPGLMAVAIGSLKGMRRGDRIRLQSAVWRRVPVPIAQPYEFEVIGRIVNGQVNRQVGGETIVKAVNEGWYVCRLVGPMDGKTNTEMRLGNPFKLEYDADRKLVLSIEDAQGDGAAFCRQCRRLYWSGIEVEREERIRHVLDFDLTYKID